MTNSIQAGDKFRPTNGFGSTLVVLLVSGEWAWVKSDGLQPITLRLTTLSNRGWYKPVPSFDVGDKVEFHTQYASCNFPGQGKVLAIHKDRAWCLFPGHSVPLSPLITSLKKVN